MRWFLTFGWALIATHAVAQDAPRFLFRYDPAPGRTVSSLAELRIVTTLTGLPQIPDGTAVESEARLFAREQVLRAAGGGVEVAVTIDSAHVRMREVGTAWREGVAPPFAGRRTRATVNDRLHVTGIETSAPEDGTVLRVLTGWIATLGFAFPDTAVAVGGTFRSAGQVPFELSVVDVGGLPVDEVLLGDLALTLDSVVGRGTDTLAYVRFAGRFAPRTVESTGEAGTRSDTFEGGFAGSLLWSTGWDAIVSAGVRVRATGRLHQETAAGAVDATVEWDATLVHRIRP